MATSGWSLPVLISNHFLFPVQWWRGVTECLCWAPGIQPGTTHHSRQKNLPLLDQIQSSFKSVECVHPTIVFHNFWMWAVWHFSFIYFTVYSSALSAAPGTDSRHILKEWLPRAKQWGLCCMCQNTGKLGLQCISSFCWAIVLGYMRRH